MVSINPAASSRSKSKRTNLTVNYLIPIFGATLGALLLFSVLWATTIISIYERYPASQKEALNSIANGKEAPVRDNQEDSVQLASKTIAYAVSVTGCGSDRIAEGAAVLKHSIHLTSIRANAGKYDYKLYAIVHPDAVKCGAVLSEFGYTIVERPTPVAVNDIKGDFLRTHIASNGCCGEKELIKLEAYTLTQHPIVVHLDLDTLILRPLDDLYDLMLGTVNDPSNVALMWPEERPPPTINAAFTRDYNMVHPQTEYKPVQGGFLALRPSLDVYDEFIQIITDGDFREGKGWMGKVGPFYGSMTFQGLIPLYYDYLHKGTAIELNRCIYNQMCDNPRTGKTVNDQVSGQCRDGRNECEDCRSRQREDIVTAHFTLCQKPWHCLPQDQDRIQLRLCRKLHHQWYRIRSDMEKSWGRRGIGPSSWESQNDHFFGYCKKSGEGGYIPIERPYGPALS